jgi:hypothetical protein
MPSTSKKQQQFMGAELARKREGKPTQTGMSEKQLHDFAKGPVKKAGGKRKG